MKIKIIPGFKAIEESRKWKEKAAEEVQKLKTFEERKAYYAKASKIIREETLKKYPENDYERNPS